jgi:hypothetical protein
MLGGQKVAVMKTFAELVADRNLRMCIDQPWYVLFETEYEHGTEYEVREVQFWYPLSVSVFGDYTDPEERREGDLDLDGCCMVRVPYNVIKGFMPGSEAERWQEMRDECERMRSYI